jgi:hypothetical protein
MAGVSVWAVSVGGIFLKLDFHFHRIATDADYYQKQMEKSGRNCGG